MAGRSVRSRPPANDQNGMSSGSGATRTSRELERQIRTQAFRRRDVRTTKVSAALTQMHPAAIDEFKNAYSFEFLDLKGGHSEADLHGALLRDLGRFITGLVQALVTCHDAW